MVFLNSNTRNDLKDIRLGLLNWNKFELSENFIIDNINGIIDVFFTLDRKSYHTNTVFEIHKMYGRKVYQHKINKKTTWYIIYDVDLLGNIFVNKIISNHITR